MYSIPQANLFERCQGDYSWHLVLSISLPLQAKTLGASRTMHIRDLSKKTNLAPSTAILHPKISHTESACKQSNRFSETQTNLFLLSSTCFHPLFSCRNWVFSRMLLSQEVLNCLHPDEREILNKNLPWNDGIRYQKIQLIKYLAGTLICGRPQIWKKVYQG